MIILDILILSTSRSQESDLMTRDLFTSGQYLSIYYLFKRSELTTMTQLLGNLMIIPLSNEESGSKMLYCPVYQTLCYNLVANIKGMTTCCLLLSLANIYPSNPYSPSYSSLKGNILSQKEASQLILKAYLSLQQLVSHISRLSRQEVQVNSLTQLLFPLRKAFI